MCTLEGADVVAGCNDQATFFLAEAVINVHVGNDLLQEALKSIVERCRRKGARNVGSDYGGEEKETQQLKLIKWRRSMVTGRGEPVVMTVMMIMMSLMSAIMGGCGRVQR